MQWDRQYLITIDCFHTFRDPIKRQAMRFELREKYENKGKFAMFLIKSALRALLQVVLLQKNRCYQFTLFFSQEKFYKICSLISIPNEVRWKSFMNSLDHMFCCKFFILFLSFRLFEDKFRMVAVIILLPSSFFSWTITLSVCVCVWTLTQLQM